MSARNLGRRMLADEMALNHRLDQRIALAMTPDAPSEWAARRDLWCRSSENMVVFRADVSSAAEQGNTITEAWREL